jgi:hypothetical protein
LHDVDDALDAGGALLEHRLLVVREGELEDLLDALAADDGGDADVDVLVAVLAVEVRAHGRRRFWSLRNASAIAIGARRGRVVGARAHEVDDLAAARARALDDRVELLLRDRTA